MPREFRVTFGGEERTIRFSLSDLRRLQTRFGFSSAGEWLIKRVLGIDLEHGELKAYNLEAQIALIAACFSRGGKPTTESNVEALAERQLESGGTLHDTIWACVCAAFASGAVLGRAVEWDTEAPQLKQVFFARTVADAAKAMEQAIDQTEPTETSPSPNGGSSAVIPSDSL